MSDEEEKIIVENNEERKKEPIKFFTPEKIVLIAGVIVILIVFGIISITKWALVDQPFFGGFFNTSYWNTPLYIFFIPVAVLLYFVAYAFWVHFQWNMMSPFHGLWVAMVGHSGVVFKTDLDLNFILKSEAGAKLVFEKERYNNIATDTSKFLNRIRMKIRPTDQSVDVAKFLQGSWDSKSLVNIGSIPASILLDANGWTRDLSPERTAIALECDKWNDANPTDQIHNLSKAWEYMERGIIEKPKDVELYVTIPWVRIDNAYPSKRFQAATGGFIRQIAENIQNGEYKPGISATWAGVMVFLVCIVISVLMFVLKIFIYAPTK